ncbi:hypothetical protein [Novosphingobium sp. KACC 22771]|uniref:hypothetical protein n=1 Tax=Novosphingobium sp. KACC 22771 TaxID=3025670 RepID=UPI0023653A80|nr:hypothetical protein [Novosphingobium sp. KACC 22771]WDF73058.1 hypothetical protein PQ467_03180 [Novosphingobium sp. KACC 22771]
MFEDLNARARAMAAHAAELVPGAAYVNYMILDPREADPDGILPGAPIYVGQTAHIAKRIASHIRQALAPGNPAASVYARMAEIIAAGQMPIFCVLEVHQTRAVALQAETVWAQRLLRGGARLCNQWPEQAQRLPTHEVARRQQVRLRNLTLTEGVEAGVFLAVRCRKRCWSATFAPADLIHRFGESATFHTVRKAARHCPNCGSLLQHDIVTRAAEVVPPWAPWPFVGAVTPSFQAA